MLRRIITKELLQCNIRDRIFLRLISFPNNANCVVAAEEDYLGQAGSDGSTATATPPASARMSGCCPLYLPLAKGEKNATRRGFPGRTGKSLQG